MCWNSAINTRLDSWYSVSSSQWGLMCDSTVAIRLCSLRNKICKTVSCGFWLALRSPETRYMDLCHKNSFYFLFNTVRMSKIPTELVARFFVCLLVAYGTLVCCRWRPRSSISEFYSQPTTNSFTERIC